MTGKVEVYLKHGSKKAAHIIKNAIATKTSLGFYMVQTDSEVYKIKQDDITHIREFNLTDSDMNENRLAHDLRREYQNNRALAEEVLRLRNEKVEVDGDPTP